MNIYETKKLKTWVEINARALKNNLRVFKRYGSLLAMIKCNAYGHGLIEAATICQEGADWLGVDTVEEAKQLRKVGITKPILIITYTAQTKLRDLLKYNLSQVVYDAQTLKAMADIKAGSKDKTKFKVHIKIDTGMSRQGILPDQMEKMAESLREYRNAIVCEGILTHLASADDSKQSAYTNRQLRIFFDVVSIAKKFGLNPSYIHAFNTAGTLRFSNKTSRTNLNRIGIGIYGLVPSNDFKRIFARIGLKPVLSWKTRIIQVKTIPKGSRIGYGLTEKVGRPSTVAILAVGYYEGIPRAYSSVGYVLVKSTRCRILGRVSMNLTVIDVSDCRTRPKVGDEAVLIGKQGKEEITAEEFAEKTKTINYEIVTRINPLIPRIYT